MFTRRRVISVVVLWLLACLLWFAPAQLLVSLLRPLLPPLQLQGVEGGFWSGSAQQAFWQRDGKLVALGKLDWQINPWSLLWLHPAAHIATSYGEQFIDTRLRLLPFGGVALRDTSAAMPAQLLGHFLPLPTRGLLALKLEQAELTRQGVRSISGDVYWQRAQWQVDQRWLALGDYQCTLQMTAPDQLHCALRGQGALSGAGDIAVDFAKKIWSADVTIKPDASLPAEFRQTLSAMLAAPLDAQGQLLLKRHGNW